MRAMDAPEVRPDRDPRVGSRVVVRHRLDRPDPRTGATLTDVVGDLVADDDGILVVRTRRGEAHAVGQPEGEVAPREVDLDRRRRSVVGQEATGEQERGLGGAEGGCQVHDGCGPPRQAQPAERIGTADMVIGAVLVPGAAAPKLVTRDQLSTMQPGAVLVDVAIDQGGCFETSRPTTHQDPIYEVDGIVHYCVANMPGAVPVTSTYALTNATLPYAIALADKGWEQACRDDRSLALGLSTHAGLLTNAPVGAAHGLEATDLTQLLS